MKFRSLLLLSVCLLFGATLVGATPADTTPAVTAPASAPEPAEPFCVESLFPQEASAFNPSPTSKATLCGSCSPSNCQGLNINASCYYISQGAYRIGKCHADSVCSGGGFSPLCICRNGPEL